MDFRLGEGADEFRAELRSFLSDAITEEKAEEYYRSGVLADKEFVAKAVAAGYLKGGSVTGGNGESVWRDRIIDEEFLRAEAPTYAFGTTAGVARVVETFGNDELKAEIIRPAYAGEIIIGYGYSEPESGSDVAAAQTRAVRDGDTWVVNGSKMFTTNAHVADYIFLLARTNTEAPKHQGLTMFVVPVKGAPGFEAQAVYTVSGERTNITFYYDVRIPDRYRIGEVDGGWQVLTHSLQEEHGAGFGGPFDRMVEAAECWAEEADRLGETDVLARLGKAATEVEVSLLIQRRAHWLVANGTVPVAEGPMSKLFSSERLERASEDLTDLIGPDGLRSYYEPTAPQHGKVEHMLRFSIGTTIYAGASEVQRNIIAQQGLGLPK
jgi:alkylation response protein AidB-like acyl-CoA dehydrogenase